MSVPKGISSHKGVVTDKAAQLTAEMTGLDGTLTSGASVTVADISDNLISINDASIQAMDSLEVAIVNDISNITTLGSDFEEFDKYMAGAQVLANIV